MPSRSQSNTNSTLPSGRPKRLPWLTDSQLTQVEELIRECGLDPNRCPTCKNDLSDIELGTVPPGTFRYGGRDVPCNCEEQSTLLRHYMAAGIPYKYMRYNEADWIGDGSAFAEVQGYLSGW